MLFDLDLIKKVYSELPGKVETARKLLNHPLTLAEKILYAHTFKPATQVFERGKDYVDFAPDRVAMPRPPAFGVWLSVPIIMAPGNA